MRGPLLWAFRIPLFYKIVLANALIVVAGAAVGVLVLRRAWGSPNLGSLELIGVFSAFALLAGGVLNVLLVRLALHPLRRLEETALRVREGEREARATESPLADANLRRLTHVFNDMLESLSDYRSRLRELALRALEDEERGRQRLARELHDQAAQTLALLLVRIRVVSQQHGGRESALLEQVREEIVEALEGIRRIARGLEPPTLGDVGAAAALRSLARTIESDAGVRIEVQADPIDDCLSRELQTTLYRIVQEALTNAVRHGDPGRVEIRLRMEDGSVVAEVRDDGVGFDVMRALAAGRRSLGLFGMRERAAFVDGTVSVESRPGEGTVVRAALPCGPPPSREGPSGAPAGETSVSTS
ncbi:MAG: ATP-binding protein [Gemmatimonadota bacterium]